MRLTMDVRSAVIKQASVSTVMLAVMMAVFYASAGHTDIPRSWLLFSVSFVHSVGSTLVLARYNPELLLQRLTIRREGSKTWDEVLMRVSNLTGLLLVPAVAGLDVGRYGWSSLRIQYAVLGLIMMTASSILTNWAMIENPHFELAS